MASSLPLFAAFRTGWYANCLAYDDQQREGGNLWLSSLDVVKPTTKFAIERSSNNNQLVHLRCCYNNKYLVKESQTSHWINAAAEEPDENTAAWSCTLFRPVPARHGGRIQLLHVQSGSFIGSDGDIFSGIRETRLGIFLDSKSTDLDMRYEVSVTDWDTLVVFPDQITFKGDNGKYLTTTRWTPPPTAPAATHALQFSTDDFGDAGVPQEVSHQNDGTILIRNLELGGHWCSLPIRFFDPVIPNIVPLTAGFTAVLLPVKTANNTIALDHAAGSPDLSQYLCRNRDDDMLIIGDNLTSIVRNAMFEIGEPVLSRQVYGVNFRLEDARIYDQEPLLLATAPTSNNTQEAHQRTVVFSYDEETESTWRSFHSINAGITMNFRVGIPLIKNFRVEISATYEGEYEWGETRRERVSLEDHYSFPVPPMTYVEARLVATKGKCDVPFSYTVRDLLTSGRTRIYEVDGGVCTGVNHYNLDRETISRPISPANV